MARTHHHGKAFIEKFFSSSGDGFDRIYWQAELTNLEFLRDLAKIYPENAKRKTSVAEKEMTLLATLAYMFLQSMLP
ncbi:MAG: hypothetical protein ABI472_02195 [Ginsengibacter sp.]